MRFHEYYTSFSDDENRDAVANPGRIVLIKYLFICGDCAFAKTSLNVISSAFSLFKYSYRNLVNRSETASPISFLVPCA